MRADRLLSILMLLETHRKMTAKDLAERLEVSERTIHRDMEALSSAGVPVYAERGTSGGWSLQEGYHVQLSGLNQAEIRSLYVNSPARILADLGLDRSAEAAYRKLTAALSPALRQDAEFARQRLHIDGAGWNSREEDVPWLAMIQTAVWEQRQLAITYQPREEDTSNPALEERIVHPLGLVAKGQVWYLVALNESRQFRSYRVARVQSARLLPTGIERPEGFDLAAYWEKSKQDLQLKLPSYIVVLLVKRDQLQMLTRSPYVTILTTRFPDPEDAPLFPHGRFASDWSVVEADFQSFQHALDQVGRLGDAGYIPEPSELRNSLVRKAKLVLGLYESVYD